MAAFAILHLDRTSAFTFASTWDSKRARSGVSTLQRADLRANRGDFPWAAGGARPGGDKDAHSLCPWRHAKDLKEAANYREQHARRGERVCRGNVCPWAMRSVQTVQLK